MQDIWVTCCSPCGKSVVVVVDVVVDVVVVDVVVDVVVVDEIGFHHATSVAELLADPLDPDMPPSMD